MIPFLIELFSSPNMVRTVRRTLLRSQLACNEMQSSARTCGRRAADSMIDQKCRLKSSQVKSVYFNHPSQGNLTNYYLILGLRDKAAPSTSQQINKLPLIGWEQSSPVDEEKTKIKMDDGVARFFTRFGGNLFICWFVGGAALSRRPRMR